MTETRERQTNNIPAQLLEQVLGKLGLAQTPEPTLAGLELIYGAWCRNIPFDNIQKLIHIAENNPGILPGDSATEFFANWLNYGTGGTCWSGNGALSSLLNRLGFSATRGVATMMVAPGLPPNHGTVIVTIEQEDYLVDASILHAVPFRLNADGLATASQGTMPAWVNKVCKQDEHWHVLWQALHVDKQIDCRIDYFPATAEDFSQRHESTRLWSPFNFELVCRLVRPDADRQEKPSYSSLGLAGQRKIGIDSQGKISENRLNEAERLDFLIDEMHIAEEIARRLPVDRPTPPPPWSESAAQEKKKEH